ncbi:hypothetical protein M0R45_008985 [Rubus argutus]|uniref:Uncharacterized protein n=1 Tax=Rubus argutus TaxID=59490 RepID=A0AAW1Y4K6_RUBAR
MPLHSPCSPILHHQLTMAVIACNPPPNQINPPHHHKVTPCSKQSHNPSSATLQLLSCSPNSQLTATPARIKTPNNKPTLAQTRASANSGCFSAHTMSSPPSLQITPPSRLHQSPATPP